MSHFFFQMTLFAYTKLGLKKISPPNGFPQQVPLTAEQKIEASVVIPMLMDDFDILRLLHLLQNEHVRDPTTCAGLAKLIKKKILTNNEAIFYRDAFRSGVQLKDTD